MKRSYIYTFFTLLLIVGIVFFWFSERRTFDHASSPEKQAPAEGEISIESNESMAVKSIEERQQKKRQGVVKAVLGSLSAPISFYGKVVDETGNPIPNAWIGYSALDKFMAPGTGYTGEANENGVFSITGIKGARLSVKVKKEGYYFIDGKTHSSFAYGVGSDNYFKSPPTKDNPAIFVLHKKGEAEPLIHAHRHQYKLSKDGTPRSINIEKGRFSKATRGHIICSRIADDTHKDDQGNFDWNFKIAVPNGGIIERKGKFIFQAPQSEYNSQIEIDMPASLGEDWKYFVEKSYFVKLADGRFARLQIGIYGGHRNAFSMEIFLNPTPGNRNLEFDPSKEIKIK